MKIFLILIFSLISKISFADTSYLCVAEKSTGFIYNKSSKKWDESFFKTSNKYIIKQTSNNWDISEMGSSFPWTTCYAKPNTVVDCSIAGERLTFNPLSLKFIHYFIGGYALPALGTDTPQIEIGVCSKI